MWLALTCDAGAPEAPLDSLTAVLPSGALLGLVAAAVAALAVVVRPTGSGGTLMLAGGGGGGAGLAWAAAP